MADKILIVDDDPETIEFLRLILERQGYQTLAARNGMESLTIAHHEHPDLVILDVMMPDLDGYEVARSLRRHPETALMPILMFTAKTQVEDKVAGYEAGVDIYLTKPVHPVELQANIKALIAQKQVRRSTRVDQGYMVGVVAAKGGLGVSTTALNLAIAFHQHRKCKVIASETRPGLGTWAQELNIPQATGLVNLLGLSPMDITLFSVEEQLVNTNHGVQLLLSSNRSKDIQYANALSQYEAVLEQLPLLAPFVVMDVGTIFLPAFEIIIEKCNEMVVVTEPQPMSVKRTRPLLDDLRLKGFGSSKSMTVTTLSHARADMSLPVTKIEEELGCSVALGIPPVPEQAFFAAKNAVPLSLVQPDGLVAQQFTNLAELIAHRVPA